LRLGRSAEALTVANRQLVLLAQHHDDELSEELGDSLMGTASALAWTPRSEQSVADQALSRVVTLVRSPLARVAPRLHRVGPARDRQWRQRLEQALKIDDALIAQFDQSVDPELHRIATEARINRCGSLFFLGHLRQSAAIFMGLLSRPDDPALISIAGRANGHTAKVVEQRIAAVLMKGTS
jgi:hypothetical protein